MEHLIRKYLGKLEAQGLARGKDAVYLALDADIVSGRPLGRDGEVLAGVFSLMNISSLLLSRPAEPYWSIIREILRYDSSANGQGRVIPMDCETRTFFHDIPVVDEFSPQAIAAALSHRKAAIIRDRGIVTYGVVTPEQAFVSFSSTCFSTFVKYFHDLLGYLEGCRDSGKSPDREARRAFDLIRADLHRVISSDELVSLQAGPPPDEDAAVAMMAETGRSVVEDHLVDSVFGNISYISNGIIYISQTGSSLDELEPCIDPVPLDGSSSVGITASSELSAHKGIFAETGDNAILHGHPKFSVVMSMHCLKKDCPHFSEREICHRGCGVTRSVAGTPIVSGEIGTGPTGLMNTVPRAMKEGRGVIVYGHGVFTSGRDDFRGPFALLREIEERCRKDYFQAVDSLLP
ncbi:MAG: class II aldolase/adducin family protein [Thermodesulfovibrionales bacterium]|jgi:ribulose-5-phosphate 4-epimerase/fuculose-1-phosphate aldolase